MTFIVTYSSSISSRVVRSNALPVAFGARLLVPDRVRVVARGLGLGWGLPDLSCWVGWSTGVETFGCIESWGLDLLGNLGQGASYRRCL